VRSSSRFDRVARETLQALLVEREFERADGGVL
jgi:hypothetical protein